MTGPAGFLDVACFRMASEGGRDRFGATVVSFGAVPGRTGPGARRVTPGPSRRALAFDDHLANEETLVTRGAEGADRLGVAGHPVNSDDVCAASKGQRETAQPMSNAASKELKDLEISRSNVPHADEFAGRRRSAAKAVRRGGALFGAHLKVVGRAGESLGYRDREDV